ncbi:four helix bundle protein [Gracilimonas sp.]|uniref:four helix bundle protein n=1 Tax=Gracilimonas sp. TaxID=1974203 RepID=UPI0032EF2FBE
MHQFKELSVWNKAVDLATDVYSYTKNFPSEEKYGLTSQIRRSVVSISSNIAEGAGRKSKKEFKHFLNIAYGSGSELETQLLIARNLGFINNENYEALSEMITEIQKMIYSLSNSLK